MVKLTKKRKEALSKFDKSGIYSIEEAIKIMRFYLGQIGIKE